MTQRRRHLTADGHDAHDWIAGRRAGSYGAEVSRDRRASSTTEIVLLSYETRSDADGILVDLQGDLDIATAAELLDVLQDALDRAIEVTVDLSAVQFIDSSGVGALVAADAFGRAKGATLALRGLSEPAKRTIKILGLDTTLTMRG